MTASAPAVVHVKRPLIEYDLFIDNIPAELKVRPQWVVFKVAKEPGKDKLEKIPKIAGSGEPASHSDLMTWRSFKEALVDVQSGQHDGLGYVFCSGDSYTGIDRDHCIRDDGTIDLAVWEDLQALNSYSETSISGTGVHTIVRGSVPAAVKRDGIEIYNVTRFFTFTGNLVPNCPSEIRKAKEALRKLWSRYAKDEAPAAKGSTNGASQHTGETIAGDEELLTKARNAINGAKFRDLYDSGNTSAYDNDASDADAALCCLLAFWTGKDTSRMDRLFRRSKLMRDKWDEKHYSDGRTYGEETINTAITKVSKTYDPLRATADQATDVKAEPAPNADAQSEQSRKATSSDAVPELPEKARIDEKLAAGASPWLDSFIVWSQSWSPRSYPDFHETVALWVLSTVAARRVVLNFGRPRYPSLYLGLCARSSLYPKTTCTDNGRAALRQSDLDWLLAPDESTPQRFIADLVGRLPSNFDELPPEARERILRKLALPAQRGWSYEEFGQHLSAMMREGSFMADWRGILRRFDDGLESYEYGTVSRGSDYVEAPYLALLVTFTPADLKPLAGKGAGLWSDGFLARFAFSTPPRDEAPRWERFPEGHRRVPDDLLQPIIAWHKWLGVPIAEIEDMVGEDGKPKGKRVVRDPICPRGCELGAGVVDRFYAYHDALLELVHESGQTDLDASYARFAEKALRVAMLLASLENYGRIELRHWARAQQVTEHWRRSLHHLYEQINEASPGGEAEEEEKVIATVRKLGGATPNDVVHWVRNLSRSAAKLRLDGLAHAGLLTIQTTRKGTPRYVLVGDEQ